MINPFHLDPEKSIPLTAEAEAEVLRAIRRGHPRALAILVERNTRFITRVATLHAGRGVDLEDLVQEGAQGLVEAAKRFQPERGLRFLTFAIWWVRRYMTLAIKRHATLIRIPEHQLDRVKPGDSEKRKAAKQANLDRARLVSHTASLETVEFLLEDSAPLPGTEYAAAQARERMERLLDELPKREAYILRRRFGFAGEAETLEDIGEVVGCSKERVRQLEKKGLAILRKRMAGMEGES